MSGSEGHCGLCQWILDNEQEIVRGTAVYDDLPVTEATELVSYN